MGARVSQDAVEVLVAPTDEKARVSQDVVEVLAQPTGSALHARVSQDAVEVLALPTGAALKARVTQDAVEVLLIPTRRLTIPAAVINLTGTIPVVGSVVEVPPAVITLTPGQVLLPKIDTSYNIGGIGIWTHERSFDIEKDPLAWGHSRPFDVGQTVGYVFTNPFDVVGPLAIIHDRIFGISGNTTPEYGTHLPPLTPLRGLVLTAPTNGTSVLHVADTTGVEVGQKAVIGIYSGTVIGVTPTTVTLDRVIP
jgi:hypothetical protein